MTSLLPLEMADSGDENVASTSSFNSNSKKKHRYDVPDVKTSIKRLVPIKRRSLINAGDFGMVSINAGSLINAGLK